jgi:hypothetical protein
MNKLETKRKLLAAESEVYRQLLKLEIQTFKVYGTRAKRRLTSFAAYLPLLKWGIPIAGGLFRRKKRAGFSLQRLGSLFFLGWKAYRQFSPLLMRSKFMGAKAEPAETAAEEYLAKRL